jgi:hypothetical protein
VSNKDYAYLQKKIDQLISELGSEALIEFLDIAGTRPDYEERVCTFIIFSVSSFYKIPKNELVKDSGNTKNSFTEPRMIISHLLKVYLKFPFRKIGKEINRSVESVYRFQRDTDHYLRKPSLNLKFVANYRIIENQLKEFIHFIEHQHGESKNENRTD